MKKVNKPSNLHMDDERVGLVHTDDYDPIIVIGAPGSRNNFYLSEARRLQKWLGSAIRFAEWQDAENKRLEKLENA